MKMIDTETGHEMVEVSGHDKKEYASKGVAGTGLGLGIAGTDLWLLSGGLGGGLFGNRMGAAGAVAAGVEKEDKCELINGMWSLAFNGQTARCNDRHQIEAEMFGLYKSQIDADFGLYKSQRDGLMLRILVLVNLRKKLLFFVQLVLIRMLLFKQLLRELLNRLISICSVVLAV